MKRRVLGGLVDRIAWTLFTVNCVMYNTRAHGFVFFVVIVVVASSVAATFYCTNTSIRFSPRSYENRNTWGKVILPTNLAFSLSLSSFSFMCFPYENTHTHTHISRHTHLSDFLPRVSIRIYRRVNIATVWRVKTKWARRPAGEYPFFSITNVF